MFRGGIDWWDRHSCLSRIGECRDILVPVEPIRIRSVGKNAHPRGFATDKNICPTSETPRVLQPTRVGKPRHEARLIKHGYTQYAAWWGNSSASAQIAIE